MGGAGWAAGDYLDRPLRELLEDVAGADPVPAAGSVVAVLGALAAGLAAKVARRSTSQVPDTEKIAERADWLRGRLEPLITADATSYTEALAARGNRADHAAAMLSASSGPVLVAEIAAEIAEIASALAAAGNPHLRYDAAAAAWIAASIAEVGADLTAANDGESASFQRARLAAVRARVAAVSARV
jgi:formiminotetrahydrofolate cyclodeaminase